MRAKGINFCRSFAGGTIALTLLQKLWLLVLVVVVGVDGSLTSSVETAVVSDMRSAAAEEEENDLMGSTVGNGDNCRGCGSGYNWWFQIPRVVVTTEPPLKGWWCEMDEKASMEECEHSATTTIIMPATTIPRCTNNRIIIVLQWLPLP